MHFLRAGPQERAMQQTLTTEPQHLACDWTLLPLAPITRARAQIAEIYMLHQTCQEKNLVEECPHLCLAAQSNKRRSDPLERIISEYINSFIFTYRRHGFGHRYCYQHSEQEKILLNKGSKCRCMSRNSMRQWRIFNIAPLE